MGLSWFGAGGGLGGAAVASGSGLVTDAQWGFLAVVASALIGSTASVIVAIIGLRATRYSRQERDPDTDVDQPRRRRPDELERRRRGRRQP